jgi:uncharacterized Fe-S radical SAM superfamily protein PflX
MSGQRSAMTLPKAERNKGRNGQPFRIRLTEHTRFWNPNRWHPSKTMFFGGGMLTGVYCFADVHKYNSMAIDSYASSRSWHFQA